jgi:hypothetical protein
VCRHSCGGVPSSNILERSRQRKVTYRPYAYCDWQPSCQILNHACEFTRPQYCRVAKPDGMILGGYGSRAPNAAHIMAFRSRSSSPCTRTPDDYRAITSSSFRLNPSPSFSLFFPSLMTKVLFSPRVDHGPRGTSVKSTNLQSVMSVCLSPR